MQTERTTETAYFIQCKKRETTPKQNPQQIVEIIAKYIPRYKHLSDEELRELALEKMKHLQKNSKEDPTLYVLTYNTLSVPNTYK